MSAKRIAKGGTRGTVYRDVARMRMEDAEALFEQNRFNGGIYLAGYAVECHLKYAVCETNEEIYLPAKFEVHDWDKLVEGAQLRTSIRKQKQVAAIYDALVEVWGPSLRYRTRLFDGKEAGVTYTEMKQLYQHLIETVP